MTWQAVFFDFDGVILDSVDIKTIAFAQMFRPYGEDIERQVVDYHIKHGGVSRFKKFQYFYEELLHRSINEETIAALSNTFSDLVLKKILEAPFMPGVTETLQSIKEKQIQAFVVSGTPEEEIQDIIVRRGLASFFLEVHGSPRQKDEIVRNILSRYPLNSTKCLFIGDALSDYQAAKQNHLCFLGIVKQGHTSLFSSDTTISHIIHL
ncbi:MAG: HAD family hydrolase [Desulfobacterales bacterium]|nr:HAD family hydrolase [Desulfobacterales bacterium]